jgi:hypothetical protein
MSAALDPTMMKGKEKCSHMSIDKMFPNTEKILSKHLCGCWKQCFLSKAVYTNTIPTHKGDQSVPFHHPKTVREIGWCKTDHFVIDCCSTAVARNNCLVLGDDRIYPLKNYWQARDIAVSILLSLLLHPPTGKLYTIHTT